MSAILRANAVSTRAARTPVVLPVDQIVADAVQDLNSQVQSSPQSTEYLVVTSTVDPATADAIIAGFTTGVGAGATISSVVKRNKIQFTVTF